MVDRVRCVALAGVALPPVSSMVLNLSMLFSKRDAWQRLSSRVSSRITSAFSASVTPESLSVLAALLNPSLYMKSMSSMTKALSLVMMTVSSDNRSGSGDFSVLAAATSGIIVALSRRSDDNCVATSKVRKVSISSPKKSNL